jgi:hypothetical protein
MPNIAKAEPPSSTEPTALDPRTLWQRVHEHLRDEIISGRLTPGTELQEVALASRPKGWSRFVPGAEQSFGLCPPRNSSRPTRCARRWR